MSEQASPFAKLAAQPTRAAVIDDCVVLVNAQVKSKRGLSGVAIKTGYAAVKTIKRRFVPEVVDALLDEWMGKVEPYYIKWKSGGTGEFPEYLTARSEDVAEELLAVTDDRASTTKHKTAKKWYGKMRPAAKRDVQAAIPELAALIQKHLAAAADLPEPAPEAADTAADSAKADEPAA